MLEEEYIFEQRYLAIGIVSEPFLSSDGQYNFLAMDKASSSNRVLRFSVVGNPQNWGLFCYEEGQELIVLNPHYLFTMEFEAYV